MLAPDMLVGPAAGATPAAICAALMPFAAIW